MVEEKKKFEPYPTRPIRMSDKTWEKFKKRKIVSGLSWDRFLVNLLEEKNAHQ